MKIPTAAFLLVLLPAAVLSLSFFDKHVVSGNSKSCHRNMRNINNEIRQCKHMNTFIFDPQNQLNTICSSGEEFVTSYSEFDIVDCIHDGRSWYPKCVYKEQSLQAKNIEVKCENGYPVHLQNLAKGPG
ncbi:hypothetical protein XENOCAPTIV_026922 [Xenoophorus captivus]|uniref:Ribonuclease A-domain domain-containing protein n=1 Tax=Xenoophorus captivus TaxID=1517983 RepID=A0ABV0QBR4_9TELE